MKIINIKISKCIDCPYCENRDFSEIGEGYRNDYYCKGLGQVQPLSDAYGKFKAIRDKRKQETQIKKYS